jgi:hypothetical protein
VFDQLIFFFTKLSCLITGKEYEEVAQTDRVKLVVSDQSALVSVSKIYGIGVLVRGSAFRLPQCGHNKTKMNGRNDGARRPPNVGTAVVFSSDSPMIGVQAIKDVTNVRYHVIVTKMAARPNEVNSETCAGREAKCGRHS